MKRYKKITNVQTDSRGWTKLGISRWYVLCDWNGRSNARDDRTEDLKFHGDVHQRVDEFRGFASAKVEVKNKTWADNSMEDTLTCMNKQLRITGCATFIWAKQWLYWPLFSCWSFLVFEDSSVKWNDRWGLFLIQAERKTSDWQHWLDAKVCWFLIEFASRRLLLMVGHTSKSWNRRVVRKFSEAMISDPISWSYQNSNSLSDGKFYRLAVVSAVSACLLATCYVIFSDRQRQKRQSFHRTARGSTDQPLKRMNYLVTP